MDNSEVNDGAAHHFHQYKLSMLFKIKHIFIVAAAVAVELYCNVI